MQTLSGAMRCTSARPRLIDIIALGHVFVSPLCDSGQAHGFRRCSVAAVGAFEYPQDKIPEMAIKRSFTSLLLKLEVQIREIGIKQTF